jgi:hypothetical protein
MSVFWRGMRTTVYLALLAMPALGQEMSSAPEPPPLPEPQIAVLAPLTSPAARPPAAPWMNTTPGSNYVPLTSRQKLDVFLNLTYSPLTFLSTAFDAGIQQAASDHEGYGQGMQGYGKRFGASFADNETGLFFQAYLLPTLLHQDPRYYRRPELPGLRRFAYAASRTILTRNDGGHTAFNASYLAGGLISTGIANTYYPFNERGVRDTMVRWGGGILTDSGLLVLHEFWPDISRKLMGTRVMRKLAGTKVGQKVERSVEERTRTTEGDDQQPAAQQTPAQPAPEK